jgi:hypothetical protein
MKNSANSKVKAKKKEGRKIIFLSLDFSLERGGRKKSLLQMIILEMCGFLRY